jgi:hypothetical protein
MDQFDGIFGCKPREYTSPLEKCDHIEFDQTKELDYNCIKRYQSMIGCLQWAASLGPFDIQMTTMTMLQF